MKSVLGAVGDPPTTPPAAPVAPAAPVPPVAEITVTAPDGVTIAPEHLKAVADFAKANGLTQVQAQQIVNRDAAAMKTQAEAQAQETIRFANQWAAECEADTEIGGAKLPATVENAKRTLLRYMTPAERSLFDASPLKNLPWIVKLLARVGSELGEDTAQRGSRGTPTQRQDNTVAAAAADIYGPGRFVTSR